MTDRLDVQRTDERSRTGVSRRRIMQGAAWSVPVVTIASAAPAYAAGSVALVNPSAYKYWETGTMPGFTSTSSTTYRLRFGVDNSVSGNAAIANVTYVVSSPSGYALAGTGTAGASANAAVIFTGAWTANSDNTTFTSPATTIGAATKYRGSIDFVINPRTGFRNSTFTVSVYGRSPQVLLASVTYAYNGTTASANDLCQDATNGTGSTFVKGTCTTV